MKGSLSIRTINDDKMLIEIEPDRTLTGVIVGTVVNNTHVELAADEIEHDGRCGVLLSDTGITFGRCDVWLNAPEVEAIGAFLVQQSYQFYDARRASRASSDISAAAEQVPS